MTNLQTFGNRLENSFKPLLYITVGVITFFMLFEDMIYSKPISVESFMKKEEKITYPSLQGLQKEGVLHPAVWIAVIFEENSFCKSDLCRKYNNHTSFKKPYYRKTVGKKIRGNSWEAKNNFLKFDSFYDNVVEIKLYEKYMYSRYKLRHKLSDEQFIQIMKNHNYCVDKNNQPCEPYFTRLNEHVKALHNNTFFNNPRIKKAYIEGYKL
jgi:hypothetical protein